jgi:hypothetical protein
MDPNGMVDPTAPPPKGLPDQQRHFHLVYHDSVHLSPDAYWDLAVAMTSNGG